MLAACGQPLAIFCCCLVATERAVDFLAGAVDFLAAHLHVFYGLLHEWEDRFHFLLGHPAEL